MSTVVPLPKVKNPLEMNDYRPIALTCSIMKCLEKIVLKRLLNQVSPFLDPMQFAYRKNRGVEDAVLILLHKLYSHLDTMKTYTRSIFIDFSSAFNTLIPHLLTRKLSNLNVHPQLIMIIQDFLLCRCQQVKIGKLISCVRSISTGVPQGCVLSPVLFSIYTNDFVSTDDNCSMIKYADDTVITGYISDDNTERYFSLIQQFVEWCDRHHLQLNVAKTKEIVIDFRKRTVVDHAPLCIHDSAVEQVSEYKYLGTTISCKLDWSKNVNIIQKKANQRLYFLRQLKKLHIDNTLLVLFYKSIIQSILTFNLICYFRNGTRASKRKTERIRKIAQRITGLELPSLESIYVDRTLLKITRIMKDPSHPLFHNYNFNRSGIRLCVPRTRRERFRRSFVPDSTHMFNSMVKRGQSM